MLTLARNSGATHVAYCYLPYAWLLGEWNSYHLTVYPPKPSNTGDMNQLLTLKCDLKA